MKKYFSTKNFLSASFFAVSILLLFAINMFSNTALNNVQLDMTQAKLYTLSTGTKNILQNLDEPIDLTFYYSKKASVGLASINSYANRVEELLKTYSRLADGKIRLNIIDPEPFSETEEKAVAAGIQAIPLDQSGTNFYFGLMASNSTDSEKNIPFFNQDREKFLEYDLTQLIYQLENPEQPKVGIISSLPLQGQGGFAQAGSAGAPWQIYLQLTELFDLTQIDNTAKSIPDDLSALMIINPMNISDNLLQAIDAYAVSGGHILMFVDSYNDSIYQGRATTDSDGQKINQLLKAWGVNFAFDQVVIDKANAKEVWVNHQNNQTLSSYPLWFDITKPQMNTNEVITGDLNVLTVSTPGYFTIESKNNEQIKILMHSSAQAITSASSNIGEYQKDPNLLSTLSNDGTQALPLALSINGPVKSAFGKTGAKDSHIILFADADMLQDRFWLKTQQFLGQGITTPISSNAYFALNALDTLTGSTDLISVRSSDDFSRPFTTLLAKKQQAESLYRAKEQALMQQLKQTEQELAKLNDHRSNGGKLELSPAQQQALEKFRQTNIEVRKEIRGVQHALNKDIESMQTNLKLLNILLMPLLVAIGGIVLYAYRRALFIKRVAK